MRWLVWLFARRSEPPSLASGLTIAQWNELYGEPALRRLFAKFRQIAIYSGSVALGLWGLVLVLAKPGQRAGRLLDAILLAWLWAVLVFTISAGMVLWKWLVDHYGDKVTYERSEGKNRGKYRIKKS